MGSVTSGVSCPARRFWILDFGFRIERRKSYDGAGVQAEDQASGVTDHRACRRTASRYDFSGAGQAIAVLRCVSWCELSRGMSEQVPGGHGVETGDCGRRGRRGDLPVEANSVSEEQVIGLRSEFDEVVAMTVASIKTLRTRVQASSPNPKSKTCNPKSEGWFRLCRAGLEYLPNRRRLP
jgi:hypothetical protein